MNRAVCTALPPCAGEDGPNRTPCCSCTVCQAVVVKPDGHGPFRFASGRLSPCSSLDDSLLRLIKPTRRIFFFPYGPFLRRPVQAIEPRTLSCKIVQAAVKRLSVAEHFRFSKASLRPGGRVCLHHLSRKGKIPEFQRNSGIYLIFPLQKRLLQTPVHFPAPNACPIPPSSIKRTGGLHSKPAKERQPTHHLCTIGKTLRESQGSTLIRTLSPLPSVRKTMENTASCLPVMDILEPHCAIKWATSIE